METNYSETTKVFCWRRLLRVPWTAERSNQSILKEINPEYSMEGLMLKVKPQYFGHVIQNADLLEKTLMLVKTEGRGEGGDGGWDSWMASLTQWTWVWVNSGRQWRIGVLQSMGSQRVGHDWATEQPPPPRSSECYQMQRIPAYTTAGVDPPTSCGPHQAPPTSSFLYPGCPGRPVNRLRTIRSVNTPRKTLC